MDGRVKRSLWSAMILFFIVFNFGCIGVTSHLMYWVKGSRVDPEYTGMTGKRVAVICVSDASQYGPDLTTQQLTKRVRRRLLQEVKRIELISNNEIDNWIDNHDWDQIDYIEIGKGVEADVVLAIELEGYLVQNNAGLLRGNTNFSVQVYDLKKETGPISSPVFGKGPIEYAFPKGHPISSTDLSQRKFEQMFMAELGEKIANFFCGYEAPDIIARDAAQITR